MISYSLSGKKTDELLEKHREKLEAYLDLLLRANRNVRLVGPSSREVLWKRHVTDCLYTVLFLPPEGKAGDLGSGAGFPGMIWGICRPDLEVVLCESILKKAAFLEKTAEALGLKNLRVEPRRCEDLAREERSSFAMISARGVAHLGIVGEYAAPLLKPRGRCLAMKGEKVFEELREIGNQWPLLGFGTPRIYSYLLEDGEEHLLVDIPREKETPEAYPRRPGRAEKRPWWR